MKKTNIKEWLDTHLKGVIKMSVVSGLSLMTYSTMVAQQYQTQLLRKHWYFTHQDNEKNKDISTTTKGWQIVSVPHDWAIDGPFASSGKAYDKQFIRITQDGMTKPMEQPGRTGGLPFVGIGWYRKDITLPFNLKDKYIEVRFDGAMSDAHVYFNGHYVGQWPYGYNSFYFDITPYAKPGKGNVLAVRLDNPGASSRWYPGAGIYRDVHLRVTDKTHIRTWGIQLQTPNIDKNRAIVSVKTHIDGLSLLTHPIDVKESIIGPDGKVVWSSLRKSDLSKQSDSLLYQYIKVNNPKLWDIGQPNLYKYTVALLDRGHTLDADTLTFGIRSIKLVPNEGFYLNGRKIRFKGVCLHHDQGPLGACANEASMRRQIKMMLDMGANAIRTSHNMPDPKFVKLCDEMGMMVAIGTFDCWMKPKVANGYNRFFKDWHEKDLVNMLRQYRNSASVMFYFIGNEIPEQGQVNGCQIAYQLQNICHREDPTRPVCNGMNNVKKVMYNNMAATMDLPGFNYHPSLFQEGKRVLPQGFILGSETVSAVSSRGSYKFPVVRKSMAKYPDHQASSYDVEACAWGCLPDDEFALIDEMPWIVGEFVWTGFDYLGEPTPYYTEWPSHSSLFGIVDLAGIPKDRYYLYRSHWNKKSHTLHVLPTWTFPDRVGKVTPIFVYTDYPMAQVWINGKSQGIQRKDTTITWSATENEKDKMALTRLHKYRLMWMNTVYEPGVVKVVAYDKNGIPQDSTEVRTAGKPDHIKLSADRTTLKANGRDISFVTVSIVDKDGTLCPNQDVLLHFDVKGAAKFRAASGGNAASIEPFQLPEHHTFNGMLTVLVQSKEKAGKAELIVTGKGLKSSHITIETK